MAERTPLMEQYCSIKAQHRDAVLFFRLGDFYEMFFEDATEVSALLDLTLTHRQDAPMCGIPYHAAKPYIARLLKFGKKIAICEQLTEPGIGKGIVERGVREIVTPGTTVEDDFLDQGSNNYLVALCRLSSRLCFAYLDLSTGEFRAFSRSADISVRQAAELRAHLYRLNPREMLVQQSLLEDHELAEAISEIEGLVVDKYPDWSFDPKAAGVELERRYGLASLKGFGFEENAPELAAAAVLVRYVDETARTSFPQLSPPLPYRDDEFLSIDEGTRRNLEIVRNMVDSGKAYSLLSVLDYTKTGPGARLLKQWLLQPLRSRKAVEARLEAVDFLYRNQRLLGSLREALGKVRDIERLTSRVAMDKANARDLLALAESLEACASTLAVLSRFSSENSQPLPSLLIADEAEIKALDSGRQLAARIAVAIKDEPSILISEGNLMREGFSPELDRLRLLKSDSHKVLEAYIEEEKAATGIQTLRVRYNKIIGYYLEVSKGKIDAVPSHFIRRQSLVTGERYTTDKLSKLESEINGATESIVELERSLFLEIREAAKVQVLSCLALGRRCAGRDCIQSFAWAATVHGYSRPRLVDEAVLRISEGRHPVVEAHLPDGAFVPNGISMDASPPASRDPAFALITGPNMAGKSTFLRQIALISLMAQAGSFVPALDAEIGMIDKIFCRVGAQDNLARGESTFLVEMHETAYILNTATARSLVIMDEVGRGTSTTDGLAIAWAVSEYLLESIACRCLFATHYHELTALEHPRLGNYSLAVLEEDEDVVFLRRLEASSAKGSYGVHVAKLAGLPKAVLSRARAIQQSLEAKSLVEPRSPDSGLGIPAREPADASGKKRLSEHSSQTPSLFNPADLVLAELESLDPDKMTPLEALNKLASLKKSLKS